MKQLKREMNEIIIKMTEEELLQNIKNTEERIMNNTKINNSWIDEQEIEHETIENRKLKIMHRTINEVINLMQERNELYEVRLVYELQEETKKIEEMKKQLERILDYELFKNKGINQHTIEDLINVIGWIEEEQEKYKL